jgi:hypothetical protein
MPRTGDTMRVINNVNPRNVVFWRGTKPVQASIDYEKVLSQSDIPRIEKLFSIKLTKDEERSTEDREIYTVQET